MLFHILNRVWSHSWSVRSARTDTNRDVDRSRSAFRQHGSFKKWASRAEPNRAKISILTGFVLHRRGDLPSILEMRVGRVTPLPQPRGALPARGGRRWRVPQSPPLLLCSLLLLLSSSSSHLLTRTKTRRRSQTRPARYQSDRASANTHTLESFRLQGQTGAPCCRGGHPLPSHEHFRNS